MQIDTALLRAARKLETDGWVQAGGGEWDAPNPNCASTAITAVASDQSTQVEAQWALAEYVGGDYLRGIVNIFKWNDAPGQTKENVIATMRACAAIWRAKQGETDASKAMESSVEVSERGSEPEAGVSRGAVQDYLCAEAGV